MSLESAEQYKNNGDKKTAILILYVDLYGHES